MSFVSHQSEDGECQLDPHALLMMHHSHMNDSLDDLILLDAISLDDHGADGTMARHACLPVDANSQIQETPSTADPRRRQISTEERKERTRARNRASQARFRQKQKEEIHRLKQSISDRQQLLSASRAHFARVQSQHAQLAQRARQPGSTCGATPFQPPPFQPSPFPTAAHPQKAQHAPLVPRHTASPLYHTLSPVPPPVSSFRATASISYGDLLEASGSATGTVDFTGASMAALVRSVRAAKAAQLGCAERDVCFFMQLHWLACWAEPGGAPGSSGGGAVGGAEGVPLSVSTSLSSPECAAAFALTFLAGDLELLLRASRSGGISKTCFPVSVPTCELLPMLHMLTAVVRKCAPPPPTEQDITYAVRNSDAPLQIASVLCACSVAVGRIHAGINVGPRRRVRGYCSRTPHRKAALLRR
eukprot:jgi/Ulvmu1/2329/UM013_0177.1